MFGCFVYVMLFFCYVLLCFQVTLCKIGDKCVVDPSAEEENCSVISLVVGVTGNPKYYAKPNEKVADFEGKCSTINMNGPGSLAPKTLKDAIHQGM